MTIRNSEASGLPPSLSFSHCFVRKTATGCSPALPFSTSYTTSTPSVIMWRSSLLNGLRRRPSCTLATSQCLHRNPALPLPCTLHGDTNSWKRPPLSTTVRQQASMPSPNNGHDVEQSCRGSSQTVCGYLGKILNAKVYDVAVETELQHAKNLSQVSFFISYGSWSSC